MTHNLKDLDILSRFIHFSKYINYEAKVVKTSIFSEKHPDGYSTFATTKLSEEEIDLIRKQYVDLKKSSHGRCDLEVIFYQKAKLLITESFPPPKHYNIFGMPVGKDFTEAEKLSLRQEMVSNSKLILYQES